MEDKLYRIREWSRHFENNRTRELRKLGWVPIPNKLDNDGYLELVEHENGAAHFGAWVVIVEIASRCEPRGILLRDNRTPHTPHTLARRSRIPESVFAEVFPRLIHIGWIEDITHYLADPKQFSKISQDGAKKSQAAANKCPRKKERKKERREPGRRAATPKGGGVGAADNSMREGETLGQFMKRVAKEKKGE